MKKSNILFLILISFLNCKQNEKNINTNEKVGIDKVENKRSDSLELITNKVNNNITEIQNKEVNLDTLIPIDILNAKNKNVYKKYGLEFTGNCYACDLAQFRIENRKVIISNVCDNQTELNFEIIKLINTEKKIEIKTENYIFIFLKIEDEQIYKLEIINYDIQNENLRISKYFTFKKNIMKFEIHDCGDFDG